MNSKLKKYYTYVNQFIRSPIKKKLAKEIRAEIKLRGFITGFQSFLHKRAGYFFREPVVLSISKYDRKSVISLPKTINPKVSIIIPMYNQIDYTYNCIRSIHKNNAFTDYEIIVADDNSSENSAILEKQFENIIVIKNEHNLGFLKNCNNAAKIAKGEYVVFLNNDTQVQKNWLAELLFVFENFKNVGLVGSMLIYPNHNLQEAGGIIWQEASGWNYGNGDEPEQPQYNYIKEADYISGASIMIKKTLWNKIGGFDEGFSPAYYEDTDLCFAVRNAGCKVMYQPFSKVVHFEGVTHGKDVTKGVKQYQVVNQQKFREKWQQELQLKSKGGENLFFERERTRGKKQILVIDHDVPTLDKDAGSRCISNFIDAMLDLGYNVKFAGYSPNPGMQYVRLLQRKGVEVLHGEEYSFLDDSFEQYLKINSAYYDAILLSRSSICSPFLIFLRNNNYKGNIIYFGHDLGYLRLNQEAIIENDIALNLDANRVKADEDFMYQFADNSLVLSYKEIDYLKDFINKPLHYVPPYFFDIANEVLPYEKRTGLLFVGGFNHPPNLDAVIWFLNEVYDWLEKRQIYLTIVGSNIPKSLFEYKKRFESLTIISDISTEHLNQLYSVTKVAVVPLRMGAGVKGKVIEAMSKGVPVVGTDQAFEGIPKDGTFPYQGANSAQEFFENVLSVYSDNEYWVKLSQFGVRYVADNFNKENMKRVFKEIIG